MLYRYRYHLCFLALLIVTCANLSIDIMEVDAAQYASISSEMAETGNYLQVYHNGDDYLDKPPLLFWLSSVSISVFGNTNIGYKLPAVIILWLGLWATYLFGRLWYDKRTGIFAALIMGSTQAFHLMTNDVRTDGLLTSFVMFAVYFLSLYLKKEKISSLIVSGLFIGTAMLAKGPIGFIIPVVAIGGHLLMTRQWKKIFDWRWLLVLPVIMIVLAPMLYGLYTQFDLHPEKEAYGIKSPSGIGFYFWTQSFGRITGENEWQNDTSFFYFFQTILWDLAPWVLLFIPALIFKVSNVFRRNTIDNEKPEWMTLFGFIVPFIALSFSNYKLPHYIFPLFPFAAVMIAHLVITHAKRITIWFQSFYLLLLHVFIILAFVIVVWVFKPYNYFILIIMILMYGLLWPLRKINDVADRLVLCTIFVAVYFQLALSFSFYPNLLKYQSTSEAGKMIAAANPNEVYWHYKHGHALDYYAGKQIPKLTEENVFDLPTGAWVYTNEEGLSTLNNYKIIKEFDDYAVTRLSRSFIDPERRRSVVKNTYLIEGL